MQMLLKEDNLQSEFPCSANRPDPMEDTYLYFAYLNIFPSFTIMSDKFINISL